MQYRPLGQSKINTSVIALGTWAIGGWLWGGTEEQNSIDAIRAGIDAGINFIDTAPAYGLGLSEEIVGKAIAGRRDQVIVATKCGLVWHTDKGTHHIDEHDKALHLYLGADSIRYECEQSLKRLNVDCIDLYQTHWQDKTTPIEETMSTLMDLKKEGKIRAIGVSNATVSQIQEYQKYGPVDTDQEKYSMLDRDLEKEHIPYCQKHNIAMLAYSPLSLGILTGKVTPEREFSGDDLRKNHPRFEKSNREKVLAMLKEFDPVREKYDLTYAQLVIAWTVSQPGMTHALVGARNVQQAQENARAGEIILEQEEVQTINQILEKYSDIR